jgi:hypothetical protein
LQSRPPWHKCESLFKKIIEAKSAGGLAQVVRVSA